MLNLIGKRSKKIGLPPGSLIYVGPPKTEKVKITITNYNETYHEEKEATNVEECFISPDEEMITWIHVIGLHEPEIVEAIGRHYNINHLILEDVLNTVQRPKIEEYEDSLFIVLKIIYQDVETADILSRQLSLVLGSNFVLSFQEGGEDLFQNLRKRIQNNKSRIRKMTADYLAYAIMDTTIDHFFAVIETFDERIESAEEALLADPSQEVLQEIHKLKQDIIFLRKVVLPIRELAGKLEKTDCQLVNEATYIYLRDLYDHTVQIVESIGTFREMVTSLLDIYHSSISNKMNEIMKVLTIIATIFIPLGFIAGVYGTNFKYMPEIEWRWGYYLFWLVVILVGMTMILYFKKKKWL